MKRIVFLDYTRVLACFMVMLVHATEMYYCSGGPEGNGWYTWVADGNDLMWVSLYNGMCRMSVPLFMIVSAYLLVPLKEGTDSVEFYKRRAARILPPFMIFSVLYCVLPWAFGWQGIEEAERAFAGLPLNFPGIAGHLWFMYPMIGLYLFLPVISPWLAKASARDERIFIGIFFVSTFIPYINYLVGDAWGQCNWNQYHMLFYFSGFLGYVVLAHYIRVHLDWTRVLRMRIGAILTLAGAVATILPFWLTVTPGEYVWSGDAEVAWAFCLPNVVLLTSGAFLMLTCIKRSTVPAVVLSLSEMSYGMYLMHILWLIPWTGVIKGQLPSVFAMPLIAVATFVSSYATCMLLSRLPGGKWVVGTGAPIRMRRVTA